MSALSKLILMMKSYEQYFSKQERKTIVLAKTELKQLKNNERLSKKMIRILKAKNKSVESVLAEYEQNQKVQS